MLKNNFIKICIFFISVNLFYINRINAQESSTDKEYYIATIAFYNVENLFDTINTPNVNDIDFTPEGRNNWNTNKYLYKLDQLSKVIIQLGSEVTGDAPAIIGLAEIENRMVLEDLVKTEILKPYNYKISHFDSPDKRGIDVAFLYREQYFIPNSEKNFTLKIEGRDDFFTRDHLLMSGKFDGEDMHFLVGHWPSRRGGQKKSSPLRNAAGDAARSVVDSLINEKESTKVVFMGDLNDDPNSPSVYQHLRAKGDINKLGDGDMYNPFYELFKKGIGSLAWRDTWNLFDQIIFSQSFLNDTEGYILHKAKVHNKQFLRQETGRFKGYPFRTFAGGQYAGGYSDHFPVYTFIIKEKK